MIRRLARMLGMTAVVALVAACGAPASQVGSAITHAPIATGEPLLDGVLPEGRCRLAETVGAPDDATPDDAAVGAMVTTTFELGADRGPLVLVEVGDGRAVVAATLYGEDGRGFDSAVWVVDRGASERVAAANDEAVAGSDHRRALVDTAGDDPVSHALAFAEDCSAAAAEPFRPPAPPEPQPSVRPELIVVEPAEAPPGAVVDLHFPQRTERGVAFQLDRRRGARWETVAWMTSDAAGGAPVTVPVGTDGYGVIDIGIGGPGPDRVRLPDDVSPGDHRICTANAGDEFCAPVAVVVD